MWPDNWQTVALFQRFITQWRIGMGGPIGLDYMPILHQLDRMKLAPVDYDDIFNGIAVMEDAALEKMREDQKK